MWVVRLRVGAAVGSFISITPDAVVVGTGYGFGLGIGGMLHIGDLWFGLHVGIGFSVGATFGGLFVVGAEYKLGLCVVFLPGYWGYWIRALIRCRSLCWDNI